MAASIIRRLVLPLAALVLLSGAALAQSKITVAIGGAACLCYLPTVLAKQLGEYEKAGVKVELVDFKGGSQSLTAMLGGSADVVAGYFDHCVSLAARGESLQAFVVYGLYPGFALVVSPKHAGKIRSVADLASMKVGVSAPGSSGDHFLKFILKKNGVDPDSVGVVGVGLGAAAVAAMEQGSVEAAVMLDPAVTQLQGRSKDLRILVDTRTQKDTIEVLGGRYPGGTLYAKTDWIQKNPKAAQALTDAVLNTLEWIRTHSPEEIMAKMPPELVGADKALYLAALKNTLPMYSETGRMDPKGPRAVLEVFSRSLPDVAGAKIDLSKTYTNRFVEAARAN